MIMNDKTYKATMKEQNEIIKPFRFKIRKKDHTIEEDNSVPQKAVQNADKTCANKGWYDQISADLLDLDNQHNRKVGEKRT